MEHPLQANWYVTKSNAAGTVSTADSRYLAYTTTGVVGSGTADIQLLAGEFLQVLGDGAVTLNAPVTPAVATHFSVHRIGNY